MTLVTVLAVVDITVHTLVLLVRLPLGVAVRTLKDCEIVRISVASGAHPSGPAMVGGEPGVIKLRSGPRTGAVTKLASRREARRFVIRIVGVVVVLGMAPKAVGGQILVIVIHVALAARDLGMHSGQGEASVVVIESTVSPHDGVMTQLALGGKSRLDVVRIVGVVVVLDVTRAARTTGQVVVAVDVTLGALQLGMRTGQRESGLAVIKLCARPRSGAVTERTIRGESRRFVVRIGRVVVVLHVAGVAGAAAQVVVPVYVTQRAL